MAVDWRFLPVKLENPPHTCLELTGLRFAIPIPMIPDFLPVVQLFLSFSWEMVQAKGGPSARSGHKMVLFRKCLIVFGGFHDNLRQCKYYNDVYMFNLETRVWTKIGELDSTSNY